MVKVEKYVKQYFIKNNIPLKLRGDISTVTMGVYGVKKAKCAASTLTNFSKKWFSEKPSHTRIYTYVLRLDDLKYCSKCDNILELKYFNDNSQFYNLSSQCKNCLAITAKTWKNNNKNKVKENASRWAKNNPGIIRSKAMKRHADKLNRTPAWADLKAIKEFYINCPKGYQVDHIIPLRGENISGLHIETNLQYLTKEENLKKSNKWENQNY